MGQNIKCENCGANLSIKERLQFCPYCGSKVQIPETEFDHAKYVLEHDEQVRKQKVKEKNKEALICIAIFAFLLLLLFLMAYVF